MVTEVDVEERVVLLDESGQPIGSMLKSEVHGAQTPLHLAFSVYVFDGEGRFLATRRAVSKHTFAGVWTNSCCGHPGPGEDLADAARRRLEQELGLEVVSLQLAIPDFAYQAVSAEGVMENEICPVFVARVQGDPTPEPSEVAEWQWTSWEAFQAVTQLTPWAISPWAVQQAALLPIDPVGLLSS